MVANSWAARSADNRSAAGTQLSQQPVQPVERAAPLARELVAAIGQQAQHAAVVIGADRCQVAAVLGDDRDAVGVDAVGLAAVAGLQRAGAGSQSRGDFDDGLARATSCWASRPPRPPAPSIAQVRCGQADAHRCNRTSIDLSATRRSSPSVSPAASERGGGVGRLVAPGGARRSASRSPAASRGRGAPESCAPFPSARASRSTPCSPRCRGSAPPGASPRS